MGASGAKQGLVNPLLRRAGSCFYFYIDGRHGLTAAAATPFQRFEARDRAANDFQDARQ